MLHAPTLPAQTQRAMIQALAAAAGVETPRLGVVPGWLVRGLGLILPSMREFAEMLYQFERPFIMDSRASERQPGLAPTPLDEAAPPPSRGGGAAALRPEAGTGTWGGNTPRCPAVGSGMTLQPVRVSILDRANYRRGDSTAATFERILRRAARAEALGYHRFWAAEHHGVPGIAGSAPTVLMAALAARTSHIRIGSGGVMLPSHQPLVIAEQAATLGALYPDRIDLGVGRSLGFTPAVRKALRHSTADAERFDADLAELLSYLSGTAPITARPRTSPAVPVFVLATAAGAATAARAGLGLVFGGPALSAGGPVPALERYRRDFRPSEWFSEPFIMISVNIAVAGSTAAARELLLPEARALAASRTRGEFPPLEQGPPTSPVSAREAALIDSSLGGSIFGTALEVRQALGKLFASTGADELLVTGGAFDTAAQDESDELLAGLLDAAGPA